MPVMDMERTETALPPEALNLPTVKYPQEVIDRLNKIREITDAKIASGELVPQTVEELAAELGIDFDDEDDYYDDES